MKHEPAILPADPAEPLSIAVARARSSYAAGNGVEHRVVREWLQTWGSRDRRSFEEWLAAWDG